MHCNGDVHIAGAASSMMKKMPPWIRAGCPVSMPQQVYDTDHFEDMPPYVIVGDSGFASSAPELVNTAFAVHEAHATARAALDDPTKWGSAADKFAALGELAVVPSTTAGGMTSGSHLNVLAALDDHDKLAMACRVAALYHDEDNHRKPDELRQMATVSRQCIPLNVVDHSSIVSQHAVVSCTASLEAASTAIETMDPTKPLDAATAFQQHVATAQLAYGVAHPSTVPPDLKASFESAQKRIAQNYSATYPTILKAATDSFVPAGSAGN